MPCPTGGFVWVGIRILRIMTPKRNGPELIYAVYRDIKGCNRGTKRRLNLPRLRSRNPLLMKEQIIRMLGMIDGVPAGIGALRITDGIPNRKCSLTAISTERIDIAGKDNGGSCCFSGYSPSGRQGKVQAGNTMNFFMRRNLP